MLIPQRPTGTQASRAPGVRVSSKKRDKKFGSLVRLVKDLIEVFLKNPSGNSVPECAPQVLPWGYLWFPIG
jgi:hypothetical protein